MLAQINRTTFLTYIGVEMKTMMSCCELANRAWGSHSVLDIQQKYPALYDVSSI